MFPSFHLLCLFTLVQKLLNSQLRKVEESELAKWACLFYPLILRIKTSCDGPAHKYNNNKCLVH